MCLSATWIRGYKLVMVCCILLFALPAKAQEPLLPVKTILNGKSFVVASGDTVRLASIQVPNTEDKGRAGEPLGEEAKAALSHLISGKSVRIDYTNSDKRDRHERLLGQIYDEKGNWIQGEMLKSGYAMVYSFADDDTQMLDNMLALEKQAMEAKTGIWANPYFRVISAEEAGEFINRYRLVEGTVVSVNESHENIYLNFNKEWRGHFAVFISRKNREYVKDRDLKSLIGKKIRVRGWINYHNAPMINITNSRQIAVVD